MESLVIGAALAGSFGMAFVLQKAALAALLRAIEAERRTVRH
ncbi:MAG TPA: hypothetical protein VFA33_19285 [Bryobacteraceae bacterium]|nr:hypothetical protein [Bryobacteraceae bacterium]